MLKYRISVNELHLKTSISKNDIHGYLAGRKTITTYVVDRINQIGETMADKESAIKEGQDAERLLTDPLLIKSYEVIQNDIFQQWIRTDIEKLVKENLYIFH